MVTQVAPCPRHHVCPCRDPKGSTSQIHVKTEFGAPLKGVDDDAGSCSTRRVQDNAITDMLFKIPG